MKPGPASSFAAAVFALVPLLLTSPAAQAQSIDRQRERCTTEGLSPDLQISACTAVIRSGTDDDFNLAVSFYNRGGAYSALGELERAIADYAEALRLRPDYMQAFYNRGHNYAALGRHDQAIADFTRAVELRPGEARVFYNRGKSYTALGQFERAIADFTRTLQLRPHDPDAYIDRGVASAQLGDYDRAIADFTASLRQEEDAFAFFSRGTIYLATGEYRRAVDDYDRALQLDPGFEDAIRNRATAREKLAEGAGK